VLETRHGDFALSDAPERFDLARAHDWISRESYWAAGIPLAVFERAVRGSLVVAPTQRPARWPQWRGW